MLSILSLKRGYQLKATRSLCIKCFSVIICPIVSAFFRSLYAATNLLEMLWLSGFQGLPLEFGIDLLEGVLGGVILAAVDCGTFRFLLNELLSPRNFDGRESELRRRLMLQSADNT